MKSFAGFLHFLMAWCLHRGFLVEVGDKISLFPPMPILPPSEGGTMSTAGGFQKAFSCINNHFMC